MQCYVNSCQLLGKFKFCFLELSGIFSPKTYLHCLNPQMWNPRIGRPTVLNNFHRYITNRNVYICPPKGTFSNVYSHDFIIFKNWKHSKCLSTTEMVFKRIYSNKEKLYSKGNK